MKGLFVDTGGWLALADARDPVHERARDVRDRWLEDGGLLVSTDYVLDETLPLIRVRLGLPAARRWWDEVDQSRRLRWEWIDPPRVRRALALFFRWKDKPFSFTDCTSFSVMRELGLRRALTPDRHFRQAGFETAP